MYFNAYSTFFYRNVIMDNDNQCYLLVSVYVRKRNKAGKWIRIMREELVVCIIRTKMEGIMSNKRITINAILNVIRTGLSIIFPLITYPYVARILGKNGVGMVSYTSSIVSYFVLFASFGISNYATREGSKNKK